MLSKTVDLDTFRALLEAETLTERLTIQDGGRTLGHWLPLSPVRSVPEGFAPSKAALAALRESSEKMETLLADAGIDPEEITRDFKAFRKKRHQG